MPKAAKTRAAKLHTSKTIGLAEPRQALMRAVKAVVIAGLPGVATAVAGYKWSTNPAAVVWVAVVFTIVAGGLYCVVDWHEARIRARKRAAAFERMARTAESRAATIEAFNSTVKHLSESLNRDRDGKTAESAVSAVGFSCHIALQQICDCIRPEERPNTRIRASLLIPDVLLPEGLVPISHFDRASGDSPVRSGYHFFLPDGKSSTTTAGYAWHLWLTERRPVYFIPDVQEHVDRHRSETDPERHFAVLDEVSDPERMKSILCLAVFHRPEDGSSGIGEQFLGILCLDSDLPGHFDGDWWAAWQPVIKPLIRLLVLTLQLRDILGPIPALHDGRAVPAQPAVPALALSPSARMLPSRPPLDESLRGRSPVVEDQ